MKATEQDNKSGQQTGKTTKYAGALPFVLIFGGLTLAMILVKVLMNLLN